MTAKDVKMIFMNHVCDQSFQLVGWIAGQFVL